MNRLEMKEVKFNNDDVIVGNHVTNCPKCGAAEVIALGVKTRPQEAATVGNTVFGCFWCACGHMWVLKDIKENIDKVAQMLGAGIEDVGSWKVAKGFMREQDALEFVEFLTRHGYEYKDMNLVQEHNDYMVTFR